MMMILGKGLFLGMIIGVAAVSSASEFQVYRNVKEFGAVGDGVHDDSQAFIAALTQGKATTERPGPWNNSQYYSQTTKPSFVFVPLGTYLITQELPVPYYTQFVGEWDMTQGPESNRPTLKFRIPVEFSPSTTYCISAGTDESQGIGWFGGVNQNNFFRSVSHMIIDNTNIAKSCRTMLHWMVSQATSLDHLTLKTNPTSDCMFMESGSGGYFGNIEFVGYSTPTVPAVNMALQIGNQQFTIRNVTIRGDFKIGVHLLWGWSWQLIDWRISNVTTAIWLANGVAWVSVLDTIIDSASFAALTLSNETQLELENVVTSNCGGDVVMYPGPTYSTIGSQDGSFVNLTTTTSTHYTGSATRRVARSSNLTFANSDTKFPQKKYRGWMRPGYAPSNIVNATGLINGTDCTAQLQQQVNAAAASGKALRLPYGVFLITDTVVIPVGSRIFGQVWTRLTATGSRFQDDTQPRAVIQVGRPGDTGVVQLADLLLTNIGPVPGAVMLEWNVGESSPSTSDVSTVSGLWDVHWRIGGASGTEQGPNECPINTTRAASPQCRGAHTLLLLTEGSGNIFLEANWGWVADHDMDSGVNVPVNATRTNIYNDRGFVVASRQGPLWFVGTAAEHSQLFQYSFWKTRDVFGGVFQTETPYMQPEFPLARIRPYKYDPPLSTIYGASRSSNVTHSLAVALNLKKHSARSSEEQHVVIHGVGSYSFFKRWSTAACAAPGKPACQDLLFVVYDDATGTTATEQSASSPFASALLKEVKSGLSAQSESSIDPSLRFVGINTHGANLTAQFWGSQISANETQNGFCSTVSMLEVPPPNDERRGK